MRIKALLPLPDLNQGLHNESSLRSYSLSHNSSCTLYDEFPVSNPLDFFCHVFFLFCYFWIEPFFHRCSNIVLDFEVCFCLNMYTLIARLMWIMHINAVLIKWFVFCYDKIIQVYCNHDAIFQITRVCFHVKVMCLLTNEYTVFLTCYLGCFIMVVTLFKNVNRTKHF